MNWNLYDTPCFMGDDGGCILLPVAAPNAKVSMIADAGTPSVYVRVWRKA